MLLVETTYCNVFQPFAAAEPSANICVAHGTLCNCEKVVLLQPHRTVVAHFVPGNFGLFRRNPKQPLKPQLKNTHLLSKPSLRTGKQLGQTLPFQRFISSTESGNQCYQILKNVCSQITHKIAERSRIQQKPVARSSQI